MRAIVTALAAAMIVALVAPHAAAQTPGDKGKATKLVREAAQLYQEGERLAAVRKFEQAYKVYPSAAILYNLGTAYRGVGRNALAHRTLSKFLRVAKKVSAKRKGAVQQTLRDIESVVGRFWIVVAAKGLRVLVDGDVVGVSPLADPVAVPPGVHQITLEKNGKELAKKTIAAGTGARVEVKFFAIATATKLPATDTGTKTDTKTGVPTPKDAARRVTDPDPLTTTTKKSESKPIFAKWWFWTAVGAAVLAGTAVALSSGGSTVNDIDPTLGQFDFGQF